MPIAGMRGWVGFAKAGAPTYLTAATAVGATSIPVNGTSVPASSTIFFIDGVNSESRAVTAGGASSTLTVAATTNAHPANTPVYWQLTASLGPVAWMPVTNIDPADMIDYIDDVGLRGSNVTAYNSVASTIHAEIGIDGDVFPDVFGYVAGSVYGAVDFSAGSPNTHTFAGMNTSASNGQPTPMLLFVYDGFNVRMFAGAKCSELAIKFDVTQNLNYTSKWMALGSCVVANYTPTFSSLAPQGAWQAAASINSVVVPNVLAADFTVKRGLHRGHPDFGRLPAGHHHLGRRPVHRRQPQPHPRGRHQPQLLPGRQPHPRLLHPHQRHRRHPGPSPATDDQMPVRVRLEAGHHRRQRVCGGRRARHRRLQHFGCQHRRRRLLAQPHHPQEHHRHRELPVMPDTDTNPRDDYQGHDRDLEEELAGGDDRPEPKAKADTDPGPEPAKAAAPTSKK